MWMAAVTSSILAARRTLLQSSSSTIVTTTLRLFFLCSYPPRTNTSVHPFPQVCLEYPTSQMRCNMSLTRLSHPVPDNTSQMTTCPIEKDQMASGEWSILVIGNNADGNPFAYERDFSLTAGCDGSHTSIPFDFANRFLPDRRPPRRLRPL